MTIERRQFLQWMSGAALCAGSAGLSSFAKNANAGDDPQKALNIVFILIDDLGWSDLACYGSQFYKTPNVDRLAAEGMRFTQAYAACPVCSPTRASIMTGKYPARLHLTDWIPGMHPPNTKMVSPEFKQELPLEEVTIAERLQPLGYRSASIGKWHLGKEPFYPEKQGFDINIGGNHIGHPQSYFYPREYPVLPNAQPGEYLTDRLSQEAVSFIEDSKHSPFFLYLSHYTVHTPIQGKPELIDRYADAIPPDSPQKSPDYAAMVQSMDESVGRVLDTLDALGLANNTIVIFTSDNGGWTGPKGTSNVPLRGSKCTLYEGGIRIPTIVRWPGVVAPGSVCDVPICSIDFHPTLCGLLDPKSKLPPDIDGISIMPLLQQSGGIERDALYWHYPHYNLAWTMPCGAVRQGDYKLIEYYEDHRLELFDIAHDLSETTNLVDRHPETAQRLRDQLKAWRSAVHADELRPNPDYTSPK